MAVGDVTEVQVHGEDFQARWQTGLYYETLTSFGPKSGEYDGLYDALTEVLIYKQLVNDALDFMHDENELKELAFRDVDDDTIGKDFLIPAGDGVGQLGGERKASQLAVLTRRKSGMIGRSFQGRNYWNFLTEGTIVGDVVQGSFASDILDWYTLLGTIISANLLFSFRLVNFSPTLGTSTPVESYGIRGRMKSQRRRTA